MKSIMCEFGRIPRIYCFKYTSIGAPLLIDGILTSEPDCAAPWHASGNILVSRKNEFIGFSYPVYERNEMAKSMALSVAGGYLKYIDRSSVYSMGVYGHSDEDFFEIRVKNEEPEGLVDALSSDGAWYVDMSSSRLLAFCFIDIKTILLDSEVSFPDLDNLPQGTPQWVF